MSGIKSYLLLTCKDSGITNRHLSYFKGKDKCIIGDAMNLIYKFMLTYGEDKFILGFYNLVNKFAKYGIKSKFRFDDNPVHHNNPNHPDHPIPNNDKIQIYENRKDKRQKNLSEIDRLSSIIDSGIDSDNNEEHLSKIQNLSKKTLAIKSEHIKQCKSVLDLLGIQYFEGNVKICKYLIEQGIVYGYYSENMETISYGCPIVLHGLDWKNNYIDEINYTKCLETMNVSPLQVINATVASRPFKNLMYCKFKQNIEFMKEYGNIDAVLANLQKINEDKTTHIVKPSELFYDYKLAIEEYSTELDESIKQRILQSVEIFKQNEDAFRKHIAINLKKILQTLEILLNNHMHTNTHTNTQNNMSIQDEYIKYKTKLEEYCILQNRIHL